MKRFLILFILMLAVSLSFVAADNRGISVQAYDNSGSFIVFDLGQTLEKPMSASWGNNGSGHDNMIGSIDHDGIGRDHSIAVTNISLNTPVKDGYFTIQSTTSFGSGFRHIQLGYCIDDESAVYEITPDMQSFEIEGSDRESSVRLYIWLPDVEREKNLIETTDYNATLSLTVCELDGHGRQVGTPQVLSIPLMGYYNADRVNSENGFLNIFNYGSVINLREMGSLGQIPVGAIEFHSGIVYGTKTPELRYVVGISPSSEGYFISDDNVFRMKRLYSASSGFNGVYDNTNSVPLKVSLKDTSTSRSSHESTSYVQGGNIEAATGNSSIYTYVSRQSNTPSWTAYNTRAYGYIYEYSADVVVELDKENYDPVDLQGSLLGGAYLCNIYFYVGTDY